METLVSNCSSYLTQSNVRMLAIAMSIHLKLNIMLFTLYVLGNRKKAVVTFGFTWQTNCVIFHRKELSRKLHWVSFD